MKYFEIFNVMLEGMVDENTSFFVTVEAAARSKIEAGNLAIIECSKTEGENLKVEEIELKTRDASITSARVIKVYGKSYFPITE